MQDCDFGENGFAIATPEEIAEVSRKTTRGKHGPVSNAIRFLFANPNGTCIKLPKLRHRQVECLRAAKRFGIKIKTAVRGEILIVMRIE